MNKFGVFLQTLALAGAKVLLLWPGTAHAAPVEQASAPVQSSPLIHAQCQGDVPTVQARVESYLKNKNIRIFAIIDHAANAASVQMEQSPATVLIFGNPAGGTPLMKAHPLMALLLPLKVLVRQDSQGQTWLTYHNMAQLAQQGDADPAHPAVLGMAALLDDLARHAAVAKPQL